MSRVSKPVGQNAEALRTWMQHEHSATEVELDAKKLVQAAGTPELAKQAIDEVRTAPDEINQRERLALALGFVSFRSLIEGSTKGKLDAGAQWYVTAIRQDEFALWNDRDCEIAGVFGSQELALASLAK